MSDFSPLSFGALWDGVTDDTLAIQAAINAAKLVGGTVVLPPGTGAFTMPLDVTKLAWPKAIKIRGSGSSGGSVLKAIGGSGHLMDCCGAKAIALEDFTLSTGPGITAVSGIFMASAAGGYDLDMAYLKNLYVSGSFLAGAVYAAAHASSHYHACKFYNYNAGGQPAIFLSAANGWSLSSTFATVSTDHGVSDLTFVACEVHDMSGNAGGYCTFLDGCGSIRFFGGNFSQKGGGNAYHFVVNNPANIGFYGTAMYADNGPAPAYVFEIPSGHSLGAHVLDAACSLTYTSAVYHGTH